MARPAETLLGFDFGTRRIGVALGNTISASARALVVLEEPSDARRFARIADLIREWQPQRLVVGRPLHYDGTPLPHTARCERFARRLAGRFGLPVELVDERFSSVEARAEAGLRAGDPEDAQAAAVILRQYLDGHADA